MKQLSIILTLMASLLMGCQNESFSMKEDISHIEVIKLEGISPTPDEYHKGEGKVVNKITNQKEIEEIIKEIEDAKVSNLANIDISLPVYKVRFFQNEIPVLTLGYYPADEKRKQSSFIDLDKDLLYTTEYPVVLIE